MKRGTRLTWLSRPGGFKEVKIMDKMYLIITLRKEVADAAEGRAIYDLVKERLADRPDVEVAGHCSNHFDIERPT